MKMFKSPLLLMVFTFLFTIHLSAQETASKAESYYVFDYMKVNPEMRSDYLALEKAWKKIHTANINAGKYESWNLVRVVSPNGASSEYNFITRTRFKGEKAIANYIENAAMPDNWQSLLTAEEIALVKRGNKIRTWVKSETWTLGDIIFPEGTEAKVSVFNYFDFKEGKGRRDHFKVEQEIWKPIHEARVKDGKLEGWVLTRMVMPSGSNMPYHDATVDLYDNIEQMMKDSPMPYFEKVHPDKDVDKLLNETSATASLVRREVRINLDSVKKSKNMTVKK